MPRYVVLEHVMPIGHERPTHWDLMLEFEGTLATWALAESPDVAVKMSAERLADHRLTYLDYEGSISGSRGTVSQWDAGEYQVLSMDPERWEVLLEGRKFRGRLTLTRTSAGPQSWMALFFAEND